MVPAGFARDMQRRIGGALLTADDDEHGLLQRLVCGSKAVDFFHSGRTSSGSCPGTRAASRVASG